MTSGCITSASGSCSPAAPPAGGAGVWVWGKEPSPRSCSSSDCLLWWCPQVPECRCHPSCLHWTPLGTRQWKMRRSAPLARHAHRAAGRRSPGDRQTAGPPVEHRQAGKKGAYYKHHHRYHYSLFTIIISIIISIPSLVLLCWPRSA